MLRNDLIAGTRKQAWTRILPIDFEYSEDLLHDYWTYLLAQKRKFDPWLEDRDDVTAANALIILIQRATALLGRQLSRLKQDFVAGGGISSPSQPGVTKSCSHEVKQQRCFLITPVRSMYPGPVGRRRV